MSNGKIRALQAVSVWWLHRKSQQNYFQITAMHSREICKASWYFLILWSRGSSKSWQICLENPPNRPINDEGFWTIISQKDYTCSLVPREATMKESAITDGSYHTWHKWTNSLEAYITRVKKRDSEEKYNSFHLWAEGRIFQNPNFSMLANPAR